MSTLTAAVAPATPADTLRADLITALGAQNVVVDAEELVFYSTDVYQRADVDARMIVRPKTVDALAAAVRICTDAGAPIIARGGGLSYTGGFLPVRPGTVIVDMLGLDEIVEINTQDMYVVVECGATWKSLYEALKPLGLRTPYFGPMSGYASTVGGALSQGSIFLGSTEYGTTADSVLSLDVVVADGAVIATGSAAGVTSPGPFFRNFGPDLTGLFLHDSGALGLKARAALRLISTPAHSGFVSFTFGTHADLLRAMSEISRRGLAAECYGADPYIWNMRLWDDDVVRDVKRVVGVIKAGRTFASGLRGAMKIALAGRRALKDVEFAMNVAVDGRCEAEVEFALGQIRRIVGATGREIGSTVPTAIRGAPFLPPNDILGPNGQRWAPSHGIAPHSRVVALVDALHAFFEVRTTFLETHGIEWGYVTFAIATNAILVEPMLYWPGERHAYHERMITPSHLAKLPRAPVDAAAAAAMKTLRSDLVAFWAEQGCAHLQIGKTYRYLETRQPAVRSLVEQIKRAVDPQGLINPGALGLH